MPEALKYLFSMKRLPLLIVMLAVGIFLAFRTMGTGNTIPPTKYERILQSVAEILVQGHFKPKDINDEFSRKVFVRFLEELDPEKNIYRFGAITESASIPERDTVIDPNLVWTANDELAGEQVPAVQLDRGRLLEGLLMPVDLRKQLYGAAPLVMLLDSTTARIHWEMVAQPSLVTGVEVVVRACPSTMTARRSGRKYGVWIRT